MLERALEIDPLYAPALAQKALVTYLMSDSDGAYGDIPVAEALPISMRMVEQALALDDTLAEAHAIKGLLVDTAGRPEEALESIRKALDLNPTMSNAANWMALAYYALGRTREGLSILEEVVKRDPTYGPAFSNLVLHYLWLRDDDRADALIERVERIVGENIEVLQARGNAAVTRGQPAEAIQLLRRGISENPNATVLQVFYGYALLDVADYETLVVAGVPDHRVLGYAMLGAMEEALQEIEELDLAAIFEPRALRNIGMALNRDGRHQAYIDYILKQYATLDGLLLEFEIIEGWTAGHLPELAYAYRATGDEAAFQRLLQVMREVIDKDRADGANNYFHDFDEALYFALAGDEQATITAVEKALDAGFGLAAGLDSHIFSSFHGNVQFEALRQRLADKVDAERAKLGMPPYRPIAATDEGNERPSFVN
jgi:tetratricopeptide (TPR) repeat protein